jgi:hypothetical protein
VNSYRARVSFQCSVLKYHLLVDSNGRMNLLEFFEEHKKVFPTLWILVQKKALTPRVVEVGCEWFFALSGSVLAPRCTRLGVRCYECLAMLSMIVNSRYIDPNFIAAEYR